MENGTLRIMEHPNLYLVYNYENPPMRTSFSVPANGFVVVRFKADNPGLWLFHCHILSHMLEGQSLLFRVADKGKLTQ